MNLNDTKSLLQSRTFWGAFTALVPQVSLLFGYVISGTDVTAAYTAITSIISAVGALIAIYGRVKAKKRIG